MIGVNKVTLIGNMTADPELTKGSDEDSDRVNFGVAINKPKRRGDDREPAPTFLDIVCWGKLASRVADWGRKGRLVYIEGQVDVRRWETDEGQKRKAWSIRAWTVNFLDSNPDRDEGRRREPEPTSQASDFDDLPF